MDGCSRDCGYDTWRTPSSNSHNLSVVEPQVAADVLAFLAKNVRAEVVRRVALETVQPSAMEELEVIMKQQFADNTCLRDLWRSCSCC